MRICTSRFQMPFCLPTQVPQFPPSPTAMMFVMEGLARSGGGGCRLNLASRGHGSLGRGNERIGSYGGKRTASLSPLLITVGTDDAEGLE